MFPAHSLQLAPLSADSYSVILPHSKKAFVKSCRGALLIQGDKWLVTRTGNLRHPWNKCEQHPQFAASIRILHEKSKLMRALQRYFAQAPGGGSDCGLKLCGLQVGRDPNMMKTSSALGEGVGEVGHLQILYFRNIRADCFCDGCRKVVPLKGLRCVLGVCGGDLFGRHPYHNPFACEGKLPRARYGGFTGFSCRDAVCCSFAPCRIVKADQRLDWVISKVAPF